MSIENIYGNLNINVRILMTSSRVWELDKGFNSVMSMWMFLLLFSMLLNIPKIFHNLKIIQIKYKFNYLSYLLLVNTFYPNNVRKIIP